jgi:HK97 family phage major capsid protein
MSIAVGTGGIPVYMPAGGASQSPYSTLFGRPVIPIEQCSKLGDKGDIILTDLSAYVGTEKGGMQIDSSIHVQFLYDEQVFRFRYRFNGAPYYSSTVASYKNSNFTMSPFVTLEAR